MGNNLSLQTRYNNAIYQMFPNPRTGNFDSYVKEFLLSLPHDTWWSQPQAIAYINRRVVEDGGVGWNTRADGKKDENGNPLPFGDPGRILEKIRRERFDGFFDDQSGRNHGPFRLNLDRFIR